MGELKLHLPNELDQRFRKTAMSVHGYGRGSISKAAIEALTRWCIDHEAKPATQTHSTEERPIPPQESDKSSEPKLTEDKAGTVSELDTDSSATSHAQN